MNTAQALKKNQHLIVDLSRSMSLWLGTPHAQKKEVRARIMELQDRALHRLQEIEIMGQAVKIESLRKVLGLLKEGVEPTSL